MLTEFIKSRANCAGDVKVVRRYEMVKQAYVFVNSFSSKFTPGKIEGH